MSIHVTFKMPTVITRVLGQNETGKTHESIEVPDGRHEFEITDNPITFLRTEEVYNDSRFANQWLVRKGTADGLALVAFVQMADRGICTIEGLSAEKLKEARSWLSRGENNKS